MGCAVQYAVHDHASMAARKPPHERCCEYAMKEYIGGVLVVCHPGDVFSSLLPVLTNLPFGFLNPSVSHAAMHLKYSRIYVPSLQLFNLDARQFIAQLLAADRPPLFTQVVMNLPSDAIEFIGGCSGFVQAKHYINQVFSHALDISPFQASTSFDAVELMRWAVMGMCC